MHAYACAHAQRSIISKSAVVVIGSGIVVVVHLEYLFIYFSDFAKAVTRSDTVAGGHRVEAKRDRHLR